MQVVQLHSNWIMEFFMRSCSLREISMILPSVDLKDIWPISGDPMLVWPVGIHLDRIDHNLGAVNRSR